MRDITVFDTLFITKIVKEFIKHRERMRSEFLKIWTEQACLLKYIIINNYSERKGQPSFPSTDSCSASFACQFFFSHFWAWYQAKASKSWPYPWLANHGQNASFSSLRKQPTFGNATTGFLTKWSLRDECRNTTLMMFHYLDLGSDSDWSCHVGNLIQPIRSTTQIWVVTRHQYGISVLISQTSFGRETSCSVAINVGCFLRL